MSPRILILDAYYPEVLQGFGREHPEWATLPYADHLQAVLNELFGTADFYSRNLRALGWDAVDVIANYPSLQGDGDIVSTVLEQIDQQRPDVVFLQDFNLLDREALDSLQAQGMLIAAQLSCAMPPDDVVQGAQVVFTSFPHYVERLRALGVRRPVYSPLACEPTAITRTLAGRPAPDRDIDVLFVGGVGKDVHWRAGTCALEALASAHGPRLHWYGYGTQYLEPTSPLLACYHGEAWGRAMYSLLLRSKVVVNRHSEVAEGCANNMRLYEATSAGALLVTEAAPNLHELFAPGEVVTYAAPEELPTVVTEVLRDWPRHAAIAAATQQRTLAERTYYQKMQQVDVVLREEMGR